MARYNMRIKREKRTYKGKTVMAERDKILAAATNWRQENNNLWTDASAAAFAQSIQAEARQQIEALNTGATHWRNRAIDNAAKLKVAEQQLAEARAQGWVKCSERLPEPNKCVLVYVPGSRCHFGAYLSDQEVQWFVFGGLGSRILGEVSHWREVPAGPEEQP